MPDTWFPLLCFEITGASVLVTALAFRGPPFGKAPYSSRSPCVRWIALVLDHPPYLNSPPGWFRNLSFMLSYFSTTGHVRLFRVGTRGYCLYLANLALGI